jgi:hypothetical protein
VLNICQDQLSGISKYNNYVYGANIKQSDSKSNIAKNHLYSCRYSGQLQAGDYIAGIDFPAGSYTFIALQGNGLIISSKPQKQYSIGINSHRILSKINISQDSIITVQGNVLISMTNYGSSIIY